MPSRVRFQAGTDTGLVRNNNEDAYFVDAASSLFAVCDGLGGHAAGEVASQMAVQVLEEYLDRSNQDPSRILAEAVDDANLRILKDQQAHPERTGMGTTLSALWLPREGETIAWIAHVGDSRIYRLRNGHLKQITEDHSPVYRLYKEGSISKDQLRFHPQKNLIERSLGLTRLVQYDLFSTEARSGDLFVLCTDGLSDCLSDQDIEKICRETAWQDLSMRLIQRALECGGFDNVTVVVVKYQPSAPADQEDQR